jgi:hypothetical protein
VRTFVRTFPLRMGWYWRGLGQIEAVLEGAADSDGLGSGSSPPRAVFPFQGLVGLSVRTRSSAARRSAAASDMAVARSFFAIEQSDPRTSDGHDRLENLNHVAEAVPPGRVSPGGNIEYHRAGTSRNLPPAPDLILPC